MGRQHRCRKKRRKMVNSDHPKVGGKEQRRTQGNVGHSGEQQGMAMWILTVLGCANYLCPAPAVDSVSSGLC